MLDTFLEYTIQKKIQFYHILRASKVISAKEISDILHTDIAGVCSLVDELNEVFDGLAYIEKKSHLVSLLVPNMQNTLKLLHAIYAHSDILHCLKFMITNDTHKPFSAFIEEYFLSKSTAYRVRKSCLSYLHRIGLDIQKNQVVGEEYRIRFLIALLYYKYGIDCCGIDAQSIRLARRFILSTNHTIDLDFLEKTENEYGYFECLLILSWKRKQYPVALQQSDRLQPLKNIFVYESIKEHLRMIIEKDLHLTFSQNDYDYIFIVYCCTNSCIFSDQWTVQNLQFAYQIILGYPAFQDLAQRLETQFGICLANNRAMRAALFYFTRKFIFELQCIIPDRHFYLDAHRNPTTCKITELLTDLLQVWHRDNSLRYPIDPEHIRCLSIQLETILRQFVAPVSLIVISDLIIEVETMALALTTKFSAQQIAVTKFLLKAQDMDFLYHLKGCVLVVTHRLGSYIKQLSLAEDTCIVSISAEINSYDLKEIYNAITLYQENNFLKDISALSIT